MTESVEAMPPPPSQTPDPTPDPTPNSAAHSIVNLRIVDEPGPWQAMNVHLDGALPDGVPAGLPFDFKAYKGTVESVTPPPMENLTLDSDVTWVSQWGKTVDMTFRFAMTQPSSVTADIQPHCQFAKITGIGITMSGYRQPITLMMGVLGGLETQGTNFPFEVVMVDDQDFLQGYWLENMVAFQVQQGRAFYMKGSEQLITRTYFQNGQLTYSADDFS